MFCFILFSLNYFKIIIKISTIIEFLNRLTINILMRQLFAKLPSLFVYLGLSYLENYYDRVKTSFALLCVICLKSKWTSTHKLSILKYAFTFF